MINKKLLKKKILQALKDAGFRVNPHLRPPSNNKNTLRRIQQKARLEQISLHSRFLLRAFDRVVSYSKDGESITPEAIEAHLSPKAVTPAITMRKTFSEREWRINRWIYCRLTEQVDQQIGRILKALKDAGLTEKTLVVFTSDHGNMDASHRLSSKGLFYDESVKVPFIIKYTGVTPGGTVDQDHLVSTGLDILPTLCDYAEIKVPVHLLGKSLRGIAEGKPVTAWRSYVASENRWGRMIRSKRFKYCVYDSGATRESLIDMENDPGEMQNLSKSEKYEKVLDEHRQYLKEWIKLSGDTAGSKYI